jgi:hypothetical protein
MQQMSRDIRARKIEKQSFAVGQNFKEKPK